MVEEVVEESTVEVEVIEMVTSLTDLQEEAMGVGEVAEGVMTMIGVMVREEVVEVDMMKVGQMVPVTGRVVPVVDVQVESLVVPDEIAITRASLTLTSENFRQVCYCCLCRC